MANTERLTESEAHEIALIYAQEKFSQYINKNGAFDEEGKQLTTLINFYKNAKILMRGAETTEYT